MLPPFHHFVFNPRTDENDGLLVFSFASKAMNVKSPKTATLKVVNLSAVGSLSAGEQSLPAIQFELSSPGAPCSRIVFDYSASLLCNMSNGTSKNDVAFFPRGNSSGNAGQTELAGTTRESCSFSIEGWTFGTVASCQIRVIIPLLNIEALTASFSVEAGPAVTGSLIGILPSQVSGASIIWSSNTSGVLCLAVQLSDAFNNPATKSKDSFLLSAFLLGAMISYPLLGETTVQTDGSGVVRWCNVRVSVVVLQPVSLHISGASMIWHIPTSINVSRSGLATAISAGMQANASALLNATTPISSGAGMPAITFIASDAAGNIAAGNGQTVMIRLRVIRVSNKTSAMYVW